MVKALEAGMHPYTGAKLATLPRRVTWQDVGPTADMEEDTWIVEGFGGTGNVPAEPPTRLACCASVADYSQEDDPFGFGFTLG